MLHCTAAVFGHTRRTHYLEHLLACQLQGIQPPSLVDFAIPAARTQNCNTMLRGTVVHTFTTSAGAFLQLCEDLYSWTGLQSACSNIIGTFKLSFGHTGHRIRIVNVVQDFMPHAQPSGAKHFACSQNPTVLYPYYVAARRPRDSSDFKPQSACSSLTLHKCVSHADSLRSAVHDAVIDR